MARRPVITLGCDMQYLWSQYGLNSSGSIEDPPLVVLRVAVGNAHKLPITPLPDATINGPCDARTSNDECGCFATQEPAGLYAR